MPEAARTLVKSPPELWAEVSDPESLTRHLGAFGEIRITRLEPEATVVWEGDRIRGTVDLKPAGWGTKVTVTAEEAEAEVEPDQEEQPVAVVLEDPDTEPRPRGLRGVFGRLFGRRPEEVVVVVEPAAIEPEPVVIEPEPRADTAEVLDGMLGSLGAAHHRPFSR